MNDKVKKELKALSKTRLLKLRADVNEEVKNEFINGWTRSVPNCDDISCSECGLMNACNYSQDGSESIDELLVEIKAEIARR